MELLVLLASQILVYWKKETYLGWYRREWEEEDIRSADIDCCGRVRWNRKWNQEEENGIAG